MLSKISQADLKGLNFQEIRRREHIKKSLFNHDSFNDSLLVSFLDSEDKETIRQFLATNPGDLTEYHQLFTGLINTYSNASQEIAHSVYRDSFNNGFRCAIMAMTKVTESDVTKNTSDLFHLVNSIRRQLDRWLEEGDNCDNIVLMSGIMRSFQCVLSCGKDPEKEADAISIIGKYLGREQFDPIYFFLMNGQYLPAGLSQAETDKLSSNPRLMVQIPGVLELFNSKKVEDLKPHELEFLIIKLSSLTDEEITKECKTLLSNKQPVQEVTLPKVDNTPPHISFLAGDIDPIWAEEQLARIKNENVRNTVTRLLCNKLIQESDETSALQKALITKTIAFQNPKAIKRVEHYITTPVIETRAGNAAVLECENGEKAIYDLLDKLKTIPKGKKAGTRETSDQVIKNWRATQVMVRKKTQYK